MWPNEPANYRTERERLLRAEAELRQKTEQVASLRRSLPVGGRAKEDYVFTDAAGGEPVRLSQLLGEEGQTLVAYSFMYAPGGKPCPMCTSMLDSLDRAAKAFGERAALVVIAKAGADELRRFARSRGWNSLRLLSSEGNSYNRDYRAETEDGEQLPVMHVWVRRDGEMRHFWASELLFRDDSDWSGQPRHVDAVWPLWNLLDLTPEGRGKDWYPPPPPAAAV